MTTRTYIVNKEPKTVQECPLRTFNQYDSVEMTLPCPELVLQPMAMFRDPFRQGKHKIVLCELHSIDGKPLEINSRLKYREFLEKVEKENILVGFEQEFFFIDDDGVPLDFDLTRQDPDICSDSELFQGKTVAVQREVTDGHLHACIYAGLSMYGKIREAIPSEWEYQLGALPVLEACDQLIVSRYILLRLVEMYKLNATFFNPNCLRDTPHRSTLHINFSTQRMREDGGIRYINEALDNISKHNQENIMKHYDLVEGNDYKWRLSGLHSMPKYDELVIKVGCKDRSSLRIPTIVARDGKGYFEERRASSEADPYDVCRVLSGASLFETNGF